MYRWTVLIGLCFSVSAHAASMDETMMKLDPEERAHQACIMRGIDTLNRSKKIKKVDRLKTSILSRAKFDGTTVIAKGGAVRAGHRWYMLEFKCAVGENQLKATSFEYELGPEIPESRYEELGLWK